MQLSKQATIIYNHTILTAVESKIIGQFAHFDVCLFPKDYFFEYESTGSTFLRIETGLKCPLGKNIQLHRFEILKRTATSYVVHYVDSIIICESFSGVLYKYNLKAKRFHNLTKRVFPLRRKYIDKQYVLQTLSDKENFFSFTAISRITQHDFDFIIQPDEDFFQ